MRAGIIASMRRPAAAGGGGGVVEYIGTVNADATGTSHTFTSVPLGAPDPNRTIIVAFAYRMNNTPAGNPGVTIAGIPATVDVVAASPANRMAAGIARATVPEGTTGTIQITYGRLSASYKIVTATFRALGATLATSKTATGSGSPATLTAPAGATTLAISICEASAAGSTATWAGIDGLADEWIGGGTSASVASTVVSGTIHPAAEWVNATTDVVTVAASYLADTPPAELGS